MNSFKVEKVDPSRQIIKKQNKISQLPNIVINVKSLSLLSYDVSDLLNILDQYIQNKTSIYLLEKTLIIVQSSLTDPKLAKRLENILINAIKSNRSKVYQILIIWGQITYNLASILAKMTPQLRRHLCIQILVNYFTSNVNRQFGIKKQISLIFNLTDTKQYFQSIRNEYEIKNKPFQIVLHKSKQFLIYKSNLQIFLRQFITWSCEKSQKQLYSLIINFKQKKQLIQFLFIQSPSSSNLIMKNLKNYINDSNIFQNNFKGSNIQGIYKVALTQWLQQGHNFSHVIQNHFAANDVNKKKYIIQMTNQIQKQKQITDLLLINYLHRYFKSQYFDFQKEDQAIYQTKSVGNWVDIYKSISQGYSSKYMNIIMINTSHEIKNWKKRNPFQINIENSKIKKFIQQSRNFYEQVKQQNIKQNKNIQLSYSVFTIIVDKTRQIYVSLEQLLNYNFDNKTFISQYPFFTQQKKQQVSKKQHNIIIEAKIVKIMKRHKISVSLQLLSKQSKYDIQIVKLAVNRLINKDIIQYQEKSMTYNYIP